MKLLKRSIIRLMRFIRNILCQNHSYVFLGYSQPRFQSIIGKHYQCQNCKKFFSEYFRETHPDVHHFINYYPILPPNKLVNDTAFRSFLPFYEHDYTYEEMFYTDFKPIPYNNINSFVKDFNQNVKPHFEFTFLDLYTEQALHNTIQNRLKHYQLERYITYKISTDPAKRDLTISLTLL